MKKSIKCFLIGAAFVLSAKCVISICDSNSNSNRVVDEICNEYSLPKSAVNKYIIECGISAEDLQDSIRDNVIIWKNGGLVYNG